MTRVFVHGTGAVSPAGWSTAALRDAMAKGTPLPVGTISYPGPGKPLPVRQVPAARSRPDLLNHARLRRASPITQYVVAAAAEALGKDAARVAAGELRLGIVLCVMSGCVNYSRRFYDEVLRDPATASPLLFPETVFNAPSSHLAALLGTPAMNYTLVGDPGTYLQALALAAGWLQDEQVDGCLVVGGEESDWMTSNAFHLFSRRVIASDGAGALYLKRDDGGDAVGELERVTDAYSYSRSQSRAAAARRVRENLPAFAAGHMLFDGRQCAPRLDAAETGAWKDWAGARCSPKLLFGEGFMAAAAWQCVLAIDAIARKTHVAANVSVVGCNQHAIGAHFAGAPHHGD